MAIVKAICFMGPPMNVLRLIKPIKDLLVPDRADYRRLYRGPARGLKMWLNPTQDLWIQLGLLETELQGHIEAVVDPGDTCYDIGTAFGYYALACKRLSQGGHVVAIDADEERLAILEGTLEANGLDGDGVDVLRAFVGEEDDPSKDQVSLDGLVYEAGYPKPDVIKMDIEGAEVEALGGAKRVLKEDRPKLIIEIHHREAEQACRAQLEAADYRVETVEQESRWLRDDPNPERKWFVAEPVERTPS